MTNFNCFCFGVIITSVICGFIIIPFRVDSALHSVGIERIEHCHNAHSNWNEIVWMNK